MNSSARTKMEWMTKNQNKIQLDLILSYKQSGLEELYKLSLAIEWSKKRRTVV
jgi:hypothetical protein